MTAGGAPASIELWLVDLARCREALGSVEQSCPRLPPEHGLGTNPDRITTPSPHKRAGAGMDGG